MKVKQNVKNRILSLLILMVLVQTSCERHEYCAECWENRPLFSVGAGDVSFCSDDAGLVDDFIYDYENYGWWCKVRD